MTRQISIDPTDDPMLKQIAFHLQAKASGPVAWVQHEGKVYFVSLSSVGSGAPTSAVVKLIQGIFERYIDHSFFILRNRIYCSVELTPMCWGMVDLAAKRATGGVVAEDLGLALSVEFIEIAGPDILQSSHVSDVEWTPPDVVSDPAFSLRELLGRVPRGSVLHDYNRAIAAILCDSEGRVLAWSTNNNYKNKTLHAEVLLLQRWFPRELPSGGRLYVSLKPCKMCANMLAQMLGEARGGGDFSVRYLEDDPGPKARGSELERRGLLLALENRNL